MSASELAEKYVRIRPENRCFARIQLRVQYSKKSSAYDGETLMVYHHRHNHGIGTPYKYSLDKVKLFERKPATVGSAVAVDESNASLNTSINVENSVTVMTSASRTQTNTVNNNARQKLKPGRRKIAKETDLAKNAAVNIAKNAAASKTYPALLSPNNEPLTKRSGPFNSASGSVGPKIHLTSDTHSFSSSEPLSMQQPTRLFQSVPVTNVRNLNATNSGNVPQGTAGTREQVIVTETINQRGISQSRLQTAEDMESDKIIIDESGNMVLKEGSRFVVDSAGGMIIDSSGIMMDGNSIVLDENGMVLGGNGVMVDETDRMLVDQDGRVILDSQGRMIMDNDSTMMVSDSRQHLLVAENSQIVLPDHAKKREYNEEETSEEFVLPADKLEWEKLFAHLRIRLGQTKDLVGGPCYTADERSEAETLLGYSGALAHVPVQTQVKIFQRLCALSNAHL